MCTFYKTTLGCVCKWKWFVWLTQKSKYNTSFLYWKCVIDLQIKVLLYVRSIREGNFKLHVEDGTNYQVSILCKTIMIISLVDDSLIRTLNHLNEYFRL